MSSPINSLSGSPYATSTETRTGNKVDSRSAAAARPPVAESPNQVGEATRQAMAAPEFDAAKVESIRQAITEGRYPLDAKRIAESFMALEAMIGPMPDGDGGGKR
jgi:negative regulator of flagellin synthesis FlgM